MRRNQQVFLTHDQISSIQRREFEAVTMRNSVRRAGLDTVAAEDAPVVIDVVDLRVTFRARDACLVCIVSRLDVDAV